MKGRLQAICISQKKGEQKSEIAKGKVLKNHGLEGDAHADGSHRSISLLADYEVDYMREQGVKNLRPGSFAENLLVSGLDLNCLGLGSRLKVGEGCELEITQIGKKCHAHCAIYYQAGDCIMPRKGIFARVLESGEVKTGDPVELLSKVSRETIQAVVLTISDRCSRGEATDTAGPAICALLKDKLSAHIYKQRIVPDEEQQISDCLCHYSEGHSIELILTVGGTGFSPRDVTPEATKKVLDRFTPGLDEVMRAASLKITAHAMLARGISGMKNRTLIINLPGSEKAAQENLAVILPALEHGVRKLRGDKSDCGRQEAD